jgi:hypothetical protein
VRPAAISVTRAIMPAWPRSKRANHGSCSNRFMKAKILRRRRPLDSVGGAIEKLLLDLGRGQRHLRVSLA